MKGLTKTIVAIALVTILIATMGMSALAEKAYSTKTTYQADGKISVEANATGLEEGDIVTYVATTDATDVNENTIVYINQAEVKTEKTSVTFNYSTEITNINASMFFGGSKENTRQEATAKGGYAITVKIGENERVVTVPEQAHENTVVVRKFDLSGIADFSAKDITGVSFGGTAIENDAYCADATTLMVYTNLINKNGTLEIATKDAVDFEKPRISATTEVVDGDLIAVAKAPAGKQFGIVVYTGEKPTTLTHAYTENTGLLVLPALGKNVEGIYAVEVEAIKEFIGDKSFKVAAYAFDGPKAELSDLVKSITIAE